LKPGIKVTDYLMSIRSRKETCRAVVYEGALVNQTNEAADKSIKVLNIN